MENIENFSFEYSLSKDNYLNYFLYNANHSKIIVNNRKKSMLFLIIFMIIMLLYVNFKNFNYIQNIVLVPFYMLIFLLYKYYNKRKYINHFQKYIEEKLSERVGKNFYTEFQNDKILGKEGNSESLISYKDFNEIIEIEKYIFVKIFSTETLILPKSINNFEKIKSNLKIISKEYNIPYNEELNWEFK